MKKLIGLISLFGLFSTVFAQTPKIGIGPESNLKYKLRIPGDSLQKLLKRKAYVSFPTIVGKSSYALTNGNKVCLLQQDQMPCIVPDMSRYNYNMPVIKGKTESIIPNAYPRSHSFRFIPKEGS